MGYEFQPGGDYVSQLEARNDAQAETIRARGEAIKSLEAEVKTLSGELTDQADALDRQDEILAGTRKQLRLMIGEAADRGIALFREKQRADRLEAELNAAAAALASEKRKVIKDRVGIEAGEFTPNPGVARLEDDDLISVASPAGLPGAARGYLIRGDRLGLLLDAVLPHMRPGQGAAEAVRDLAERAEHSTVGLTGVGRVSAAEELLRGAINQVPSRFRPAVQSLADHTRNLLHGTPEEQRSWEELRRAKSWRISAAGNVADLKPIADALRQHGVPFVADASTDEAP